MGHSETTGGTQIGILESASTLDFSCVFVPKSSFVLLAILGALCIPGRMM